jgi:hypothetical protein
VEKCHPAGGDQQGPGSSRLTAIWLIVRLIAALMSASYWIYKWMGIMNAAGWQGVRNTISTFIENIQFVNF